MFSDTLQDEYTDLPNFELLQEYFFLTLAENKGDENARDKFLKKVVNLNMAPWYEMIYDNMGWIYNRQLHVEMKAVNEEALHAWDDEIEENKKHESISDVKDIYLKKANYLISIGDKEKSLKMLRLAYAATMALGYKLDNIFTCIRIGFFFADHELITKNLQKADEIVQMGVDYDRRNRLKIYKGFRAMMTRNFETAARLFLDNIATFNCRELMDYTTFVTYTVYMAAVALPRHELKKKLIECCDLAEALHQTPLAKTYLDSLYQCEYSAFFKCLAEVEQVFRCNFFLNPHYKFYVREMKIKAYNQLLSSYQSLTITYMAQKFGVTTDFIENDLYRFIWAERMHIKIDRVSETIVITQPSKEKRSDTFRKVIKQGDLLLNRIQRLGRIMECI